MLLDTRPSGGERPLRRLPLLADLLRSLRQKLFFQAGRRKRLLHCGQFETVVLDVLARTAYRSRDARRLLVRRHSCLAHCLGLTTQLAELAVERLDLGIRRRSLLGDAFELGGTRRCPRLALIELLPQLREALDEVLALLLQQEQTGVEPAEDRLHAAALFGKVADEEALLLQQRLELLEFALLLGQPITCELDIGVGLLLALLGPVPRVLQLAQLVDGQGHVDIPQLAGHLGVLGGAVSLALQRSELALYLARHVPCPLQVRIHARELAQRALFSLLVLEDSRGLFDERAPILRPRVQDLVEPALADDRMRVTSEPGVVEQLLDVHEASRGLVDEVLALAVAKHPSGDRDLGKFDRKRGVAVVEHEVDLGDADGLPGRRAGEDHVLHRGAAKRLRRLLAKDPEHGVGYVGLARAVGADDDGDAWFQGEDGAIGKGLEALEYESFEVHEPPLQAAPIRASEGPRKRALSYHSALTRIGSLR